MVIQQKSQGTTTASSARSSTSDADADVMASAGCASQTRASLDGSAAAPSQQLNDLTQELFRQILAKKMGLFEVGLVCCMLIKKLNVTFSFYFVCVFTQK